MANPTVVVAEAEGEVGTGSSSVSTSVQAPVSTTANNIVTVNNIPSTSIRKKDNVRCDDEQLVNYRPPRQSIHWMSLPKNGNENDDGIVAHDLQSLISLFRQDLERSEEGHKETDVVNNDNNNYSSGSSRNLHPLIVLYWSCIVGYCEAISTSKDEDQRHKIFPVPIGKIKHLVDTEFDALIRRCVSDLTNVESKPSQQQQQYNDTHHRQLVQSIANTIWSKVVPKSNVRDEMHANSVYVCLRSTLTKKSLDCFGSTLCTVLGVQYYNHYIRQERRRQSDTCQDGFYYESYLTLSEDHAYERHILCNNGGDRTSNHLLSSLSSASSTFGTCEVAVPGNTKLAQSKRGRDIAETINDKSNNKSTSASTASSSSDQAVGITPATSWLYMSDNAVMCDSAGMTLVAVVANINPTIDSPQGAATTYGSTALVSGQLYRLKRDMLWALKDNGYMERFPFGLIELGDCEENVESYRTTSQENQWVETTLIKRRNSSQQQERSSSSIMVLQTEQMFLEAIDINRRLYNESQVYPYLYAAHYHKDAGKHLGPDEEYRLVESMRMYARAAHVASKYPYDASGSGCLQLNKHMTTAAMLILNDIMMSTTTITPNDVDSDADKNNKMKKARPTDPRSWVRKENAVAFGTWLLSFYDSLLVWEESSPDRRQFVEILSVSHKYSLGKLFAMLDLAHRLKIVQVIFGVPTDGNNIDNGDEHDDVMYACTSNDGLVYCKTLRSQRLLSSNSMLLTALMKSKISISEMALTLITPSSPSDVHLDGDGATRSSRRSKRPRV